MHLSIIWPENAGRKKRLSALYPLNLKNASGKKRKRALFGEYPEFNVKFSGIAPESAGKREKYDIMKAEYKRTGGGAP